MKMVHGGEKGLTLIELLIVIAILGIIAAVIIPNIAGFITSGNVAAANTELENVKTGALGFYATYSEWPTDSNNLTNTATNNTFVSGTLKAFYTFDTDYGWVMSGSLNVTDPWDGIVFCGEVGGITGNSGQWVAGDTCPA